MNRDIFFIFFIFFFQHKLLISSYGKTWILQARSEMEADRKLSVFYLELLYVAGSCCRYNAGSDWLIVRHYSPAMPTGWLRACKNKAKSYIINNLLTSKVRSLRSVNTARFRSEIFPWRPHSRLISSYYYMAVSHKDWELPNSRIWLAEIDIDRGLDFPI